MKFIGRVFNTENGHTIMSTKPCNSESEASKNALKIFNRFGIKKFDYRVERINENENNNL